MMQLISLIRDIKNWSKSQVIQLKTGYHLKHDAASTEYWQLLTVGLMEHHVGN